MQLEFNDTDDEVLINLVASYFVAVPTNILFTDKDEQVPVPEMLKDVRHLEATESSLQGHTLENKVKCQNSDLGCTYEVIVYIISFL